MQYHEKNSSVPFYAYNFIALVRGHTCKPQLRLKHFSLKFANISDVIWKQFAWRQRDVASFAFASNDTIQRWRHRRSKKLNKNGTGSTSDGPFSVCSGWCGADVFPVRQTVQAWILLQWRVVISSVPHVDCNQRDALRHRSFTSYMHGESPAAILHFPGPKRSVRR